MPGFPHSKQWHQVLMKTHDRLLADHLISRARSHYDQLPAGGPPAKDITAKMTRELRDLIYPGLAMYRALLEIDPDKKIALAQMEMLMKEDFFRGLGFRIGILNYLPDPFPIIRIALRMMTRSQYPSGYQAVVQDDRNYFEINAIRCFKLEVLTWFHASELTRLYCMTDDWLSKKLPKIRWLRTKTLAQGNEICDFRWSRIT